RAVRRRRRARGRGRAAADRPRARAPARRGRPGGRRPLGLDAGRVRRPGPRPRAERPLRPPLLLVARTRYELPLSPSLERKFTALRERFDVRVLATSASGRARDDGTFRLVGRL